MVWPGLSQKKGSPWLLYRGYPRIYANLRRGGRHGKDGQILIWGAVLRALPVVMTIKKKQDRTFTKPPHSFTNVRLMWAGRGGAGLVNNNQDRTKKYFLLLSFSSTDTAIKGRKTVFATNTNSCYDPYPDVELTSWLAHWKKKEKDTEIKRFCFIWFVVSRSFALERGSSSF